VTRQDVACDTFKVKPILRAGRLAAAMRPIIAQPSVVRQNDVLYSPIYIRLREVPARSSLALVDPQIDRCIARADRKGARGEQIASTQGRWCAASADARPQAVRRSNSTTYSRTEFTRIIYATRYKYPKIGGSLSRPFGVMTLQHVQLFDENWPGTALTIMAFGF
jgi:hypothetical protein